MKLRIAFLSAALLAAAALAWAAGPDLTHAKCPIVGGQAMASSSVDYKGGKVYFCCAGCDETFKADPKKYAAKANYQLFVTGQAKQIACPLAFEAVSPGLTAKVGDATVGFCCPSCKDEIENMADDDAKIEKIFNDEAFAKAFNVVPQ
ncbi:MAG: YHS domain-containing protein [Bryobacterales bacterium]